MNLRNFINIYTLIFFIFLASTRVVFVQSYITWDDIKVKSNNLDLTDEKSRKCQGVIAVDQNGNGDSVTVQGAIDMVPVHNSKRVKILIRPGTYREKVIIPASKPFISLIGDEHQARRTTITWNNKASDKDQYGNVLGTSNTATVAVESDYFCASGITIENTVFALPQYNDMQAVALRLSGDRAMLYKVRILGSQDTLYDESGSHYFYKCVIQGTVDFICGNARSLYQGCILHSIAEDNMGISGAIAAHQRNSADEDTGFSFVNCKVSGSGSVLLGRAWGEYSRIIYSHCSFDGLIAPEGWYDWDQLSREKHAVFGEYKCRGKGANRYGRVPWAKSFSKAQVKPFLNRKFIGGEHWLRV
ncbi:pectinesterase QRT1-like [Lycium barbarum]|uniref:pectinesterase QRT1-like n=1 Tax=Lycium barbarum TaxID=112863 RepID=UPI00293EF6C6|nr:pectinesterase QRT1-like [Lycium barbarum]